MNDKPKTIKCEGSCEEHYGEVSEVTVVGYGKTFTFNYCEEAIREDKRRGFEVKKITE